MKIKKKIRDFVYAHVSTKKRAVLAKKWGKVNTKGLSCKEKKVFIERMFDL